MPSFMFMRHGETDANINKTIQGWSATSLTENGHQQVLNAVNNIAQTPDAIISSDLLRCQQTTEIIASLHPSIPVLYDWRLRERAFGTLEGQHSSLVDWDIFFAHDTPEKEHNVEPESHLNERIKAALRDTQRLGVETLLIVTHGGILNRIGAILVENFSFRRHDNGEIVTYSLEYDDPRLLPADYTEWSMNHGK